MTFNWFYAYFIVRNRQIVQSKHRLQFFISALIVIEMSLKQNLHGIPKDEAWNTQGWRFSWEFIGILFYKMSRFTLVRKVKNWKKWKLLTWVYFRVYYLLTKLLDKLQGSQWSSQPILRHLSVESLVEHVVFWTFRCRVYLKIRVRAE